LKRSIFLMRDFTSLKLIRGVLFRPKLFIIASVDTPSRDTIPLILLLIAHQVFEDDVPVYGQKLQLFVGQHPSGSAFSDPDPRADPMPR
jgi:hypothetical protein